jgi:hypothetical protein
VLLPSGLPLDPGPDPVVLPVVSLVWHRDRTYPAVPALLGAFAETGGPPSPARLPAGPRLAARGDRAGSPPAVRTSQDLAQTCRSDCSACWSWRRAMARLARWRSSAR